MLHGYATIKCIKLCTHNSPRWITLSPRMNSVFRVFAENTYFCNMGCVQSCVTVRVICCVQQIVVMIGEWLWWDRLWLPGNLTWTDLKDEEGLVYAKVSHLYVIVPYALVFLLVRYLFERRVGCGISVIMLQEIKIWSITQGIHFNCQRENL